MDTLISSMRKAHMDTQEHQAEQPHELRGSVSTETARSTISMLRTALLRFAEDQCVPLGCLKSSKNVPKAVLQQILVNGLCISHTFILTKNDPLFTEQRIKTAVISAVFLLEGKKAIDMNRMDIIEAILIRQGDETGVIDENDFLPTRGHQHRGRPRARSLGDDDDFEEKDDNDEDDDFKEKPNRHRSRSRRSNSSSETTEDDFKPYQKKK